MSSSRHGSPQSPPRLTADVERGFSALEEGRIDDAAELLEKLQKVDRKNADVVALTAAIADARGEIEEALARYVELSELRPDDPMPRICIARIQLHDQGNPDEALETIDAVFDFIDEERDLIDAVMLRAEALIVLDDLEAARGSLSELATSVIDEPDLALDLAELALAAEDFASSKRWIEIGRKEPELVPDALHLLGRVYEATDDRTEMVATWKQVRALDAAAAPGDVSISEDEIVRIAEEALAELSEEANQNLERVAILIDDLPSDELIADGVDPRLLGLFQGTGMADDSAAPSVTTIHLFKRNLERVSHDLDELAEQVRITVLHETAHYFGLDEEDLENLGLD